MQQAEPLAEDTLDVQFAACLDKLQELQSIVSRQQWRSMEQFTSAYESSICDLQRACENVGLLPKRYLEKFQHLFYNQRRVMRAIHQAMETATESITSANKGLLRIERLSVASKIIL